MENLVSSQTAPQAASDYEASFNQLMAEMERLNEQMRSDRADIERLKAETQMLKAETRAVLASMGAKL